MQITQHIQANRAAITEPAPSLFALATGMSTNAMGTAATIFLLATSAVTAMPSAPETAATFVNLSTLLPCQPDIAALAASLGYRETAQTRIDTDYADIQYSDAANQSRLTVSFEDTPIGALFSVLLDIPGTDQAYADTIVTALRQSWSLPASVQLQNLGSVTAQFWTIGLPNGTAQITVRHGDMNTQLSGILEPLTQGIPLPC